MQVRDYLRQVIDALALKFVRDTIAAIVGNVVVGVFGLLIYVVLVGYYGTAGLGHFALAMSVYLVLHVAAVLGIGNSVTKHVAERSDDRARVSEVFSAGVLVVLVSSAAVTLLAWAACPVLARIYESPTFLAIYRVLIIALPLVALNKVSAGLLNGLREMRAYAAVQAGRYVLVFAGINAIHFATGSLTRCAYAVPAAEAVLLIAVVVRFRLYRRLRFPRRPEWINRHLHFGFYCCFHDFVGELYSRIDLLVVGLFLSPFVVGLYAFASEVARGLTAFSILVQVNFNPIISRLWAGRQREDLQAYVTRVKKSTYLLYVPITALAAVGYPLFVVLFKGGEMAVAAHFAAFYILLAGVFIVSGYVALMGLMAYTGHVNWQLRRSLYALLIDAAGSLVLVPVVGIAGAAVSTCLAFLFAMGYTQYFAGARLGISIGRWRARQASSQDAGRAGGGGAGSLR